MTKKNQDKAMSEVLAPKNPKRPIMIASAIALALSLLSMPVLGKHSEAILDNGGFCIVASDSEGFESKAVGAPSCAKLSPGVGGPIEPPVEDLKPVTVQCQNQDIGMVRFSWGSIPDAIYVLEFKDSQGEIYELRTSAAHYTFSGMDKWKGHSQDLTLSVRYVVDSRESSRSESSKFKIAKEAFFSPAATCA